MPRLIVISNGIGEDSVGAEIVKRLPPDVSADAYPTLGDGRYYRGVCPVVGPRATLPSEGSRINRGTLVSDVAAGGLATIAPAIAFLRRARAAYDRILVVGDFIGVGACWLAGVRGIVYLDVYKTGHGRLYSLPERLVIRRTCRTVFVRSPRLAAQLKPLGVDARAAGNIMMDTIPVGDYDAGRRRLRLQAVTLLPGSREAITANFALQIEAITLLPDDLRPDVFVAVADGIEPEALAQAAGLFFHPPATHEISDLGRLSGRGLHVHMARGALRPLVEASDLVLSQAGTATIQSLGLGRPVITFVRESDRAKRFVEENRLFGESRQTVPADAAAVADAAGRLLANPAERQRRGEIGALRIGGPGVIDEIIAALTQESARPAPEAASR